MRRLWLAALFALIAAAPAAWAAESQKVTSSRATATLVSETDAVAPGQPFRVGLRLAMAPGWHTYWKNPGDAGIPPELAFTLPAGAAAGPVAWPAPGREKEGPLTTFAYTGDLLLPVTITGAGGATAVELHAEWLVCAKVCVPESGDFRLDLPAGAPAPSPQAGLFAEADRRLPGASPWPATIAPDGTLYVPGLSGAAEAWFAPDSGEAIEAAGGPATLRGDGLAIALRPGAGFRADAPLSGVLTVREAGGAERAVRIAAAPGPVPAIASPPAAGLGDAAPAASLARLLGLALLGGLALNLMPCVFPVLVLKTVGLAGLAGARRGKAALHAASYAGGVLLAFAALGGALLALRSAGGAVGWGFQFQSPAFVAATAWVLFGFGLNLSGVFHIGMGGLAGAGHGLTCREDHSGSFFTGLLAVLVATPCTAPFMGAAIAGALAASPAAAMAVFLAMGVGLALPYVALALAPGVARALPRPGQWMNVVKQAFAFPMYGAAVWLLWVMSQEAGSDGVLAAAAGLLLVGVAAWLIGLVEHGGRGRRVAHALAGAAALGAVALLPTMTLDAAPTTRLRADGAEPFTAARLAALQADGRPVFVDMTAAWCVTCLVNERLAIAPRAVQAAFAERRVAYLRGDWTRRDPEITAFLRRHGRDGVPLYVFFPADGGRPSVLPQVLTQDIVLAAIAARG